MAPESAPGRAQLVAVVLVRVQLADQCSTATVWAVATELATHWQVQAWPRLERHLLNLEV
jgi:hypothetical protein